MTNTLCIWVVYEHPSDFPEWYVARRWELGSAGEVKTDETIMGRLLSEVRARLESRGLTMIPRFLEDDPVILECWL